MGLSCGGGSDWGGVLEPHTPYQRSSIYRLGFRKCTFGVENRESDLESFKRPTVGLSPDFVQIQWGLPLVFLASGNRSDPFLKVSKLGF